LEVFSKKTLEVSSKKILEARRQWRLGDIGGTIAIAIKEPTIWQNIRNI
jgi:hypothetical protein